MRNLREQLENSVLIEAPPDIVWQHITDVDIASFRHPASLITIGIPKPLRAEIDFAGVGGRRTAFFANGKRFFQQITAWVPNSTLAFTFVAEPGFRVGHVLDLAEGPFRIEAGEYRIDERGSAVRLSLSSTYELRGIAGVLIRIPVRCVLKRFQSSLLDGIRVNAERTTKVGRTIKEKRRA